MRESEAKKKTCPHMLTAMKLGVIGASLTPGISQSEFGTVLDITSSQGLEKCQGSDCMMWEQDWQRVLKDYVPAQDDGHDWRETHDGRYARMELTDTGDCGLKTKDS